MYTRKNKFILCILQYVFSLYYNVGILYSVYRFKTYYT